MAIDKVLFFPVTLMIGTGARVDLFAPTVDDLTTGSTGTYSTVALVKTVGAQADGLYIRGFLGTWRRVLPYLTLSGCIFESVDLFEFAPAPGTTILPISGMARPEVYRNAIPMSSFTVRGDSVVLSTPSQTNDTFCILNFKGGGIADAPADNKAYVRKSERWDLFSNQTFDEGTFGS